MNDYFSKDALQIGDKIKRRATENNIAGFKGAFNKTQSIVGGPPAVNNKGDLS